jgi:hypothetical protein
MIGHARALDLLLNRENPRHEPKKNQQEILEYLLSDEEVYNLARHISANGVNPLEVIAVFPDDEGNLVVAEGNRRLCALQLLNDPKKAPLEHRSRFEALAKNAHFPESVMIARFDEYEDARPWLKIIHDGEQDGIGRRRWRPEQKARFTETTSTSNLAVKLLDYAIAGSLIAKEEKDTIRLTTMTRYLQNPRVRKAMGIATTSTNPNVQIELSGEQFAPVVAQFMEDARTGVLHSRSTSEDWHTYAESLEKRFKTNENRGPATPIDAPPASAKAPRLSKTKKLVLRRGSENKIDSSDKIVKALNDLGSAKLSSIYGSLTSLSLTDHPALLTAGAWMLLESLTALHGRNPGNSFEGYIHGRINSWGLGREAKKEIGLSVKYIADHGNAEKHSALFTSLDARNLKTHFQVLDNNIARLIEECSR